MKSREREDGGRDQFPGEVARAGALEDGSAGAKEGRAKSDT